MVIHPSGLFNHRTTLRRDHAGIWRGRAEPNQQQNALVGDAPQMELTGGTLTLVRTQFEWPDVFHRHRDPLTARMSFQVGGALEAVLEDGDVIQIHRAGTGDLAATVTRNGRLVAAIGAVERRLAELGIAIDTDPRARDVDFYGVARMRKKSDVKLIWLDADDPGLEQRLAEARDLPVPVTRVILVARSVDRPKVIALNQRAFSSRHAKASWWFYVAPDRVQSEADFLAYLDHLPETRPDDLWLRFTIEGRTFEVREGQYQHHDPWQLFVAKVDTPGTLGEHSQLGLARVHPNLTPEMLLSSVRRIATGSIDFNA